MEISAEKTKLLTNRAYGIKGEINVKGQKLGMEASFSYRRAVSQMLAQNRRFSQLRDVRCTAALTNLKPVSVWRDSSKCIYLESKVKLLCSFFSSIFLTYETEFVLFLAVLEYKYLLWVYGVDRKICHEGH